MTVTVIGDNTGDDYSGTVDTYLSGASATSNFGSSSVLSIRSNDTPNMCSLIAFTGLSNISSSEVVSDASLNVYNLTTSIAGSNTSVRRILRDFVEGQATWNIWSTGNNWTTAGAQSQGNDIASTETGTFTVGQSAGYYSLSSAQLITDYQGMIDGTYPIYGHRLFSSGSPLYTIRSMGSSEGTDGQRPYAVITHAAGGSTDDLLADDIESSSELTSPAVGQEHALLANDVESSSEVTAPTLVEGAVVLLADDLESASEVTAPTIGQEHALSPDNLNIISEVSVATITQIHGLLANDVESTSEVLTPTLVETLPPPQTTMILNADGHYIYVDQSAIRILASRPSEADRFEFSPWGHQTLGGVEETDIDYFKKDHQ